MVEVAQNESSYWFDRYRDASDRHQTWLDREVRRTSWLPLLIVVAFASGLAAGFALATI
jgi:hypothetical protein